jgi:hypothetical protein
MKGLKKMEKSEVIRYADVVSEALEKREKVETNSIVLLALKEARTEFNTWLDLYKRGKPWHLSQALTARVKAVTVEDMAARDSSLEDLGMDARRLMDKAMGLECCGNQTSLSGNMIARLEAPDYYLS